MNNTANKNSNENQSSKYQRLSQLEHILKRPDTYIGSTELTEMEMWCFDEEKELMEFRKVNIVPGLYKIFDEILVNAADNKIRDKSMKVLNVKIDPINNLIEIMNDGKGIPVQIHDKEKIYIPELIFGNLLTSSNYDDNDKKITGGRNGYGAKLCNIFSELFELETYDTHNGLLYKQTWTKNMSVVLSPVIKKIKSKKEYTKILFKPDLIKFGMNSLDNDIVSVMKKRVYDLCGTVNECSIFLNEKKLNIKNFKSYVELYVKALEQKLSENDTSDVEEGKTYLTVVHEIINERWEVAFAVSDSTFYQISFVNSIATINGGTHVKFISDQIITKLIDHLTKKEKGKKKLLIKPQDIRNNMFLFVNCLIENPAFNSQTKEQLITKVSQYSNKSIKINISDQFINKILKTKILDKIKSIVNLNEDKTLQKVDGSKKVRIKGQTKLVDANKAGTKDGYKCVLILTEGDSALSLAVSGLTVIGRDFYGCFPLKGKLLNVREASTDQIAKNTEISALKQIIGLQHKKVYTTDNIKDLRYGHIMIMTDQDQDGSHIKGLIINFFESCFPELLKIPGFLLEFITPIVKVTIKKRGGKQVIPFYTLPEFENWRETEGTLCHWTQKYYKGLGTSTPVEAREYFASLDKHLKKFHALQEDDKQYIDLAFSKKKADDRKEWLQAFKPGTHLNPELMEIPISEFINKELILFSIADNVRSIPSVLDGLKPGQRKVLYACFKRNLKSEIKVSQLSGYVSEHTGYHHGEQSLIQTIIGLAQNFVGSNNINLLKPNGAFGTRAAGGKDFSAARYIFTELNEITKKIFNPLDNKLYTYIQEDEQTVEPQWYLPIVPMVLINGAEGIGTGWSTNIPCYNPIDIVENIRRLMKGEPQEKMIPWYKNWTGEIEPNGADKYKVIGRIELCDENIFEITEIPVKTWTNTVREFLLNALNGNNPWIKDFEEQHGLGIKFVVKMKSEETIQTKKIGLLERFKLISSLSTTNMVAFDPVGRIKRYTSSNEILSDFYYQRLEFYDRRKSYMLEDLQNQLTKLSEQARFIMLIIEGKLSVSNKKIKELLQTLQDLKFVMFSNDNKPIKDLKNTLFIKEEEDDFSDDQNEPEQKENKPKTLQLFYEYLLGMPIWSLTKEKYDKLLSQKDEKQKEFNWLKSQSPNDLWNIDLDDFLKAWNDFLDSDYNENMNLLPPSGSKKKTKRQRTKTVSEATTTKNNEKLKKTKTDSKITKDNVSKPIVTSVKQQKSIDDFSIS